MHNTATSALKDEKARKALELADEICHLDEGNERQNQIGTFHCFCLVFNVVVFFGGWLFLGFAPC